MLKGKKKGVPKSTAGGSATTGGINYQAAVTAIVAVHLSRGIALNWLPGLAHDVPVAVLAETGGSGDDIRVVLKGGDVLEAQVKRGLAAGDRLWEPLEAMVKAIISGDISYGVLVVTPDSSNTIRTHLAQDLTRIGDGREDGLKELAIEFKRRLKHLGLDAQNACSKLRIVICSCDDGNDASVAAACAELPHLVEKQSDVRPAWNELYQDAERLMRLRGQRDATAVLNVIESAGIALKIGSQSPSALIAQLSEWVMSSNEHYTVFGIDRAFPIDGGWIPINIIKRDPDNKVPGALAEAIQFYHDWHKRVPSGSGEGMAPEALGRFYHRGVVVAGPGMGKSTLMKKLARIYAGENRPVLKVRLPLIAARMKRGAGFEEALFAHGLDGSGLAPQAFIDAAIPNWVLLCDGLDECGQSQETLAESLIAFAAGHRMCSIIVATRPIGYTTALLKDWRHYELLPLAVDKEREHLSTMLASIYPDDAKKSDAILGFALREIKASESSKAVARSPLLLGLALYLAMEDVPFGKSKEQLYEKIFEVIDAIPNDRDREKPPSKAILLRFLEILAWDNVRHPISSILQTLGRCAVSLAEELGRPLLSATETAEQCSNYWQTVGLLERISHAGDETLTFIHKTFGEYAAGRYLARANQSIQAAVIPELLERQEAAEILSFAGVLGAATVLCRELLKGQGGELKHGANVGQALALVAEASPSPDEPLRREIFMQALTCVQSQHEVVAYAVATPLRDCALRFPEEVGPLAAQFVDSDHPWSRLAAWAIKVAAGPAYYDLPALELAFATIPAENKSSVRSSLGGGAMFSMPPDKDLVEEFAVQAMRALLKQGEATRVDALIKATFKLEGMQTLGMVDKGYKVLREFGKDYSLVDLTSSLAKLGSMNWDLKGYKAASDLAFTKMVEPLTEGLKANRPVARKNGRLIWLSAFFDLTDVNRMGASDVHAWRDDKLSSEAAMVIRYVGELIDVDSGYLAAEAQELITYMAEQPEDGRLGVFDRIAPVDAPPIDWDKARGRGFDLAALERAIYHPSDWLMTLAARLLDGATVASEREPIVERILAAGKNAALGMAASLAQALPPEVGERLVRAALKVAQKPGAEYLFEFLSQRELREDEELLGIVRAGLNGKSARIAKAAAKLALSISKVGFKELSDMLRSAYAHWQVHEQPYPVEGGVVPESPREEIVKALLVSSVLTDDELFQIASDRRPDVQGAVKASILDRIRTNEAFRRAFLVRTKDASVPNRILIDALRNKQPLSADEIAIILAMSSSPSPKVRYASLGVLNEGYLAADVIAKYLDVLVGDREQEIRERAMSIRRGKPT